MANIGIDIDGTISALPAFFSFMSKALMTAGHKIYIITYRASIYRDITIQDLKNFNIEYTEVYLCDKLLPAHIWKAQLAEELQLDMMFEDALENLAAMSPRVARVWVGEKLQSCTIQGDSLIIGNPNGQV
jgi:uncharacterized HAD superfamily protein